jgi:hypothetical protein
MGGCCGGAQRRENNLIKGEGAARLLQDAELDRRVVALKLFAARSLRQQ